MGLGGDGQETSIVRKITKCGVCGKWLDSSVGCVWVNGV